MCGYIPLSLIIALPDPPGPAGLLPGGKPPGPAGLFPAGKLPRPIRFRWLRLFRARRFAPEAVPQAEPAHYCCAVPSGPAS